MFQVIKRAFTLPPEQWGVKETLLWLTILITFCLKYF